jgi:hypothetical protein
MTKYGYIYKITLPEGAFNKNGRPFYIGQKKGSKVFNYYYGSGLMIVNYIKKYGIKELQREILAWADSLEELNQLEYDFVHPHFETELCLNLREGGDHSEMSIESRRKMSVFQKGRKHSEESRRKISEKNMGKKLSEETRLKIGETSRGRVHSEETRQKIGESQRGRTPSKETRQKMSNARMGISVIISEDQRKKISEANMGHTVSADTRRKMSAAQKGKSFSEEHRQKLREAWTLRKKNYEKI